MACSLSDDPNVILVTAGLYPSMSASSPALMSHRRLSSRPTSRGMNGVTQREWSFLLLLWGLSDPRIAELREMPQSFSIKLHSETQVSGRLGMSGGTSPRHAQNPLSGERRKTLSITHHALSPSHHHLYIIHLINWLQRFCLIIMSLKRPFVPKSDVKQWFTTTTYLVLHVCQRVQNCIIFTLVVDP